MQLSRKRAANRFTICRHFIENDCKFGENCWYYHPPHIRADTYKSQLISIHECDGWCGKIHELATGKLKGTLCEDYIRGRCVYGALCKQKHCQFSAIEYAAMHDTSHHHVPNYLERNWFSQVMVTYNDSPNLFRWTIAICRLISLQSWSAGTSSASLVST